MQLVLKEFLVRQVPLDLQVPLEQVPQEPLVLAVFLVLLDQLDQQALRAQQDHRALLVQPEPLAHKEPPVQLDQQDHRVPLELLELLEHKEPPVPVAHKEKLALLEQPDPKVMPGRKAHRAIQGHKDHRARLVPQVHKAHRAMLVPQVSLVQMVQMVPVLELLEVLPMQQLC